MSRVLLLSEAEAKTILYSACAGGHRVVAAGNVDRNPNLRFHPKLERFVPLNEPLSFDARSDALIDEILEIVRRERIDVLLPSSFDCIRICSAYRERIEAEVSVVPTPDLETVAELDDKGRFFEFCRRTGLAHPDSWLLDDLEELRAGAFDGLPFPVIAKPTLGAGGEGLTVLRSASELSAHFLEGDAPGAATLPVLLQDYFEGEDIDFNGFAVDGVLSAGSVMRTRFYEGKPAYTITDFIQNDDVFALGEGIVRAARYSGPLNIDMRIRADDGTVQLIEVNPRFWARVMYSLIDGINFIDLAIRSATDRTVRKNSDATGAQWPSDLSAALFAAFRHGDAMSWQCVRSISAIQLRYIAFAQYYGFLARWKNRGG